MPNRDKHDTPDKPKLEELLRVKRLERPNDAFWDQFDRELHQRMLQTLVRKEPWYLQTMRALSGRLAQGAAVAGAALVVALLLIRPIPGSGDASERGAARNGGGAAGGPVERSAGHAASPGAEAPDVGGVALAAAEEGERDYAPEAITPDRNGGSGDRSFKREFAMDSINGSGTTVAAGENVISRSSYGTSGVASLVY